MTDTKYNGWTNYATWRVNLEWFDNFDLCVDFGHYTQEDLDSLDAYDLKDDLKELVEMQLECDAPTDSNAYAYAMAFLNDVYWYEIATHVLQNAKDALVRA